MALQNISLSFPSEGYFGLAPQTASPAIPSLYNAGRAHLPPAAFNDEQFPRERYQHSPLPTNVPQQRRQVPQYPHPVDQKSAPTRYAKVDSASSGPSNGKTSVHAILDYDDDFEDGLVYPEQDFSQLPGSLRDYPSAAASPTVTPIQGPILLKNGSVPVVPLYSYPKVNNGSFVQIPIMWAALSLALGYELRGDFVRGSPCIKRNHQLFCPTAGNSYPIDRIEKFIDDNKALMRRMYGEFETNNVDYGPPPGPTEHRQVRTHHQTTFYKEDSYFSKGYSKRQTSLPKTAPINDSGRVDTCESKLEVVTPYWGSNSAGKVRAIVNTQHFEQAIHQEICSKSETGRCSKDCRCEQKYKWHRLLAYDPSNDCKGIFMDWFLYPSCCVCRCSLP